MKRKLVRAGNSLAVTLPAEVVETFGLKKGQTVELSVHPQSGAITIRAGTPYLEGGKASRRFKAALDELLTRRAAVYRELAK